MTFDPQHHHRQSLRLQAYDYAQAGAYFVTVCTQGHLCLFGEVVDEAMQLNDAGHMVVSEWHALRDRFTEIEWDEFIVMPNHIHGIVVMQGATNWATVGAGLVPARPSSASVDATNRATTRVAPTVEPNMGTDMRPDAGPGVGATLVVAHPSMPARPPTIGDIMGAFKSLTTVAYTRGVKTLHWPAFHERLWQRNYYEHIIRNGESMNRIRQYIIDNPSRWAQDKENPSNIATGGI